MLGFYPPDGQSEVAITNVGVATADGLPLERAALTMPELQHVVPSDDGDQVVPLTGDDLVVAAQEWAARAGLIVGPAEELPAALAAEAKAAQAERDAQATLDADTAALAKAQAAANIAAIPDTGPQAPQEA